MIHEKSCGAVVIKEGSVYLIVQETQGHWGIPKGHVEQGETEEETAMREIIEETGVIVKIRPDFRRSIYYQSAPDKMKTVVFFVADYVGESGGDRIEPVAQYIWMDYDSAIEHLTHKETRSVLEAAHKYLNPSPG